MKLSSTVKKRRRLWQTCPFAAAAGDLSVSSDGRWHPLVPMTVFWVWEDYSRETEQARM